LPIFSWLSPFWVYLINIVNIKRPCPSELRFDHPLYFIKIELQYAYELHQLQKQLMCQSRQKDNYLNFIQIQYGYLKAGRIYEGKYMQQAWEDKQKNDPSLCKISINQLEGNSFIAKIA